MFRFRQARNKRRRYRWFQFSLRALLVLIAVTAAFCAWWLRPETRTSTLAGGLLTLREQLRTSADGDAAVGYLRWLLDTPENEPVARGGYWEEQAHGRWSSFYADGRVAVRGVCRLGKPVGNWRCWWPGGTPRAETRLDRHDGSQGQTGSLRFWWPNGRVRMQMSLRAGREQGPSSGYDVQGRLIASGTSTQGRRNGWWSFTDPAGEAPRELYYAHDLPVPEIEDHLARLNAMLRSGDAANQITAASVLERLGPLGVQALITVLAGEDEIVQTLALRALGRMGEEAAVALPEIRTHVDAASPLVRLHACLAAFLIDTENRARYRAPLLTALNESAPHVVGDLLLRVFDVDVPSRGEVLRRLLLVIRHADRELATRVQHELGQRPAAVTPLLEDALNDPDLSVRSSVLELMVAHRGSWSEAERWGESYGAILSRAFEKAAQDSDPELRRRARDILAPPRGSGFGRSSGGMF